MTAERTNERTPVGLKFIHSPNVAWPKITANRSRGGYLHFYCLESGEDDLNVFVFSLGFLCTANASIIGARRSRGLDPVSRLTLLSDRSLRTPTRFFIISGIGPTVSGFVNMEQIIRWRPTEITLK